MLVDYAYYKGPFGGQILSEEDFSFCEPIAERYVHSVTFWRLKNVFNVPDEFKLAVCAVCDVIQAQMEQDCDSSVKSESVGSYSVTYEDVNTRIEREDKQKYKAASYYLLPTGFMDRSFGNVFEC